MKNLLKRIDYALAGIYDASGLETVRKALCTELLGIDALSFYTKEPLEPDSERERLLEDALRRLAGGEPLQYVCGNTPFCGLSFRLDGRVLIPRPETGELVEWVLQNRQETGNLLDIGTGSGCIAVTLAHRLPGWSVEGWDISPDALRLAALNNELNGTDVTFRGVDILTNPQSDIKFDVIVSNPPYVTESEKLDMEKRVLDFEPDLALFVPDDDPLLFYRAISRFASANLTAGGSLFFEINPLFAHELVLMLESGGYHNIELRKDLYGKERMIKADT